MGWQFTLALLRREKPAMPSKTKDTQSIVLQPVELAVLEPVKEGERRVYVLLTRYTDTLSKAVSGLSWGYYSHVSIGFDPAFDTFFSFTMKGFRIETPSRICKKKKKDVPCILYSLPVPEAVYRFMHSHVDDYLTTSNRWKFNLIGLACSMAHLPFYRRRRNHRFCSQFVAEVLELDTTIEFGKKGASMLPKDFLKMPKLNLEFKGTLTGLAVAALSS